MFLQSLQFPCPETQMIWKCSELWTCYIRGDLTHGSVSDASACFFLKVSDNHESQTPQQAVRERWSSAHSFVNAAVSPSTSTSYACMESVGCLSGKQSLGVLPDAWGSSGLEQASWHPQPHLPDWDPIPNLPIALTQCHFMYVCWISF